ncbi:hypothetical protein AZE42_04890 [Rhizopogon vesiculosus]|uniref:Uncharacterized protein n=1 Tax=Rhizopogon vesiculosus TaxID=180088 RepID=A0A1J8PLX5_9AGAM|nr:hypothetical protein AZE42_04890 [Rhizopogon vesiculosus]
MTLTPPKVLSASLTPASDFLFAIYAESRAKNLHDTMEISSMTKSTTCSQPTVASVLDNLLASDNGFYAATSKLASRAEYFAGGQKNILVVKGKDTDEEFIIWSVFQISQNDFYFTPDANFDPVNVFQRRKLHIFV